jgi:hypothetical protein
VTAEISQFLTIGVLLGLACAIRDRKQERSLLPLARAGERNVPNIVPSPTECHTSVSKDTFRGVNLDSPGNQSRNAEGEKGEGTSFAYLMTRVDGVNQLSNLGCAAHIVGTTYRVDPTDSVCMQAKPTVQKQDQ